MIRERFANVLAGTLTTLSAGVDADDTALPVDDAAPAELYDGEFRIRVGNELMLVTGGQDTTTWAVERGVEGSTAASHGSGAAVTHPLTAEALERVVGRTGLVATDFGARGDAVNMLVSLTNGSAVVGVPTGTADSEWIGKAFQADQGVPAAATVLTAVDGADSITISANATVTASGVDADIGTDDTAAIQAAIDELDRFEGGKVLLPVGRFLVSQEGASRGYALLITQNEVTVEGVNSGFKSWQYNSLADHDSQGGSTLVTHEQIELIRVWRRNLAGIDQGSVAGWKVCNLGFRGAARGKGSGVGPTTPGASIGIRTATDYAGQIPSDGGVVSHCSFIKLGTCMQFDRDDSLNVENNWIGESGLGCVYADPTNSANLPTLWPKFIGNGIYDITAHGLKLDDGGNGVVANNRFARCFPAIEVLDRFTACLIVGNNIADPAPATSAMGIQVAGDRTVVVGNIVQQRLANPTGSGVLIVGADDCVVSDNLITGFLYGAFLNAGLNCRVTANTIRDCQENGIRMANSNDCLVHGNLLFANGQLADNTYDQILLNSACDRNSIQGNVIRKGAAANQARYGIRIANANCDQNLVTNNDLLTAGDTGGLSDLGTGTVTTAGNRL